MTPFDCHIVQFETSLGPADDGTLDRMTDRIRAADADLVVFPEMSTTGYAVFDRLPEVAEAVPGPTTDAIAAAAVDADAHVLFGMPVADGDAVRNAAVWIDRDGERRLQYHKRHLWGEEQDHYAPGEGYAVVDADVGRVGVQVCYDLNFPEMSAAFARAEVDVVVNISAWSHTMERDWHTLLPARAVENGAFVVGCNIGGTEGDTTYCGRSKVVAPDGEVLVELGSGPGVTTVHLDPRRVEAERRRNPMRRDRPAGAPPDADVR